MNCHELSPISVHRHIDTLPQPVGGCRTFAKGAGGPGFAVSLPSLRAAVVGVALIDVVVLAALLRILLTLVAALELVVALLLPILALLSAIGLVALLATIALLATVALLTTLRLVVVVIGLIVSLCAA